MLADILVLGGVQVTLIVCIYSICNMSCYQSEFEMIDNIVLIKMFLFIVFWLDVVSEEGERKFTIIY